MRHLDLFSGIGGFALAASWVWGADHKIHSFVEIEPFCQKVLNKHWPDVTIHDDIRTYKHDGTAIDLLTGGFPCQPFSIAGKRRGKEDDRALWPYMLEIIQASRPTWIVGENVAGIVNMELDNYISDLEGAGYGVQALIVPACAKDARHRRDRVWVVANSNSGRCGEQDAREDKQPGRTEIEWPGEVVADTPNTRIKGLCERKVSASEALANPFSIIKRRHGIGWPSGVSWWEREPQEVIRDARQKRGKEDGLSELESKLGRVAYGIPNRVDRLRGLGNAIVPQVVAPIMQAIKIIEDGG